MVWHGEKLFPIATFFPCLDVLLDEPQIARKKENGKQ